MDAGRDDLSLLFYNLSLCAQISGQFPDSENRSLWRTELALGTEKVILPTDRDIWADFFPIQEIILLNSCLYEKHFLIFLYYFYGNEVYLTPQLT